MDLCEFKDNLVYRGSMQKQMQVVVLHTFSPSSRETCTFNSSPRGNIRREERYSLLCLLSLQSLSLGKGKISLIIWQLCFSGCQVESQYLILGFYYLYYIPQLCILIGCDFL